LKYRWLLFDADGTLFDYDKAEAYALRTTFREFGLEYESHYLDVYRPINAQIWLDFEKGLISAESVKADRFQQLFDAIGVASDAQSFSARYLKNLGDSAELIEGAENLIQALHGRVSLMLITNGLKDVQRSRLARSAIAECFADIVISEEVDTAKPHPGIFDAAFARMGGPRKEEVLLIGDSLTADIRGGNEYGIDTCWYNPEGRTPDSGLRIGYEIRHLEELLDILSGSDSARPLLADRLDRPGVNPA
jgi:2-haloacid dehalogenase